MSLILDALRKADAERERGAVPSLHSQPLVASSEDAATKPRARFNLLWIAIGAAVGLLGAAAMWVMVGRGAPPAVQAARVESTPGGPAVASPALPQMTAQQVPPRPAPTAPQGSGGAQPSSDAVPAAATPGAVGAATASAAVAASPVTPVAEPAPWRAPEERKSARPETKADAPVPILGNVPPAQSPVYSRDQLPADIRAQLPQLTVGGSIYSPQPSGRSLIVNGQLFRERDRLTQDLTLEEIGLKAAVFSFRGYRFEVMF